MKPSLKKRCREADEVRAYYVTLQRGSRTAWLLGPYKVHQRAIDAIPEATAAAEQLDPWTHFDAYGTGSVSGPAKDWGKLPPGKLNSILPHLVVDA